MKRKKTLKLGVALMTAALSVTGVLPSLPLQEDQVIIAEAAKPVKLNVAKKVYLIKGKTKTLKLLNAKGKVKWSSNKKTIATINSKGLVRAKKSGVTTITAVYNGKKYKCTLVVEAPRLSNTKLTLTTGQSKKIALKGTKQQIKWVSAKSSVASVNKAGVITAKKAGTVKIAAKVGSSKYYCTVTVKNKTVTPAPTPTPTPTPVTVVDVQSVTLDKTTLELEDNNSTQLNAVIAPANATNKTVIWSSSAPAVATVDNTGKVQAVAPGSAIITVRTVDGNYSASCQVNVKRSLGSNYEYLKNYILQNGDVNAKGNKFIKSSNYSDGTSSTWGIVYEQNEDKLHFIQTCEDYSNRVDSSVSAYIDVSKSNSSNVTYIAIFKRFNRGYEATAVVNAATYTGNGEIPFEIESNTGNFSYKNMQGLSNVELRLAFMGWNNLIYKSTGLTLVDLGFTAYNPQ